MIKTSENISRIAKAGFSCLTNHSPMVEEKDIVYERKLSVNEDTVTWYLYSLKENIGAVVPLNDGSYNIEQEARHFLSIHIEKDFCQIQAGIKKFNHKAAIEIYNHILKEKH